MLLSPVPCRIVGLRLANFTVRVPYRYSVSISSSLNADAKSWRVRQSSSGFSRSLSTTARRLTEEPPTKKDEGTMKDDEATMPKDEVRTQKDGADYEGPFAKSLWRAKLFSVWCWLTCTGTSVGIVTAPSTVANFNARIWITGLAVGSCTVAWGFLAYLAHPYVTAMRQLTKEKDGVDALQMETLTAFLSRRATRIYDPEFLVASSRGMARWELAKEAPFTQRGTDEEAEETIAETFDAKGRVKGSWIVKWDKDGKGVCRRRGRIHRYFYVHKDLVPNFP